MKSIYEENLKYQFFSHNYQICNHLQQNIQEKDHVLITNRCYAM